MFAALLLLAVWRSAFGWPVDRLAALVRWQPDSYENDEKHATACCVRRCSPPASSGSRSGPGCREAHRDPRLVRQSGSRAAGYRQGEGLLCQPKLDVDLIAPADPNDPPKLVAAKQADIAGPTSRSSTSRSHDGLPVRACRHAISTPLNTLVALADGPIKTMADLKGKRVGFSVGGFEDVLLGAMLAKHGLEHRGCRVDQRELLVLPGPGRGQVDAVIGAYRNVEMPQMALIGHPGRGFYPEEEGVPPYDELIYVAHRDSVTRPELPRFLRAVEAATHWILNRPDEAWQVFKATDRSLDNEANARSWQETIRRFSPSPAALDQGRYQVFADFLKAHGLIGQLPALSLYARDVNAVK